MDGKLVFYLARKSTSKMTNIQKYKFSKTISPKIEIPKCFLMLES
jgi:hypothetical protein